MLKKIFKTIFIMSLCAGISLPTNAAVSVSDGSAFVTKAEFAADLNNLSNRMAQLENSLDAKIDSLVSSNLTRNGIWNGAKQDLLNTDYLIDKPATHTKSSSIYIYNSYGARRILFTSNKSGLAYIQYSYKAEDGTDGANCRWGYRFYLSARDTSYNDYKIYLSLYWVDEYDIIMSSVSLGSSSGAGMRQDDWNYLAIYVPIPYSEIVGYANFFVNKGVSYYIYTRSDLIISPIRISETSLQESSSCKVVVKFDDTYVY